MKVPFCSDLIHLKGTALLAFNKMPATRFLGVSLQVSFFLSVNNNVDKLFIRIGKAEILGDKFFIQLKCRVNKVGRPVKANRDSFVR